MALPKGGKGPSRGGKSPAANNRVIPKGTHANRSKKALPRTHSNGKSVGGKGAVGTY